MASFIQFSFIGFVFSVDTITTVANFSIKVQNIAGNTREKMNIVLETAVGHCLFSSLFFKLNLKVLPKRTTQFIYFLTEHSKPRYHQQQEKANKHRHEHDKDNKWNSQSVIAAKINKK